MQNMKRLEDIFREKETYDYVLSKMLKQGACLFENRNSMLQYLFKEKVDNKLEMIYEFGVYSGHTINYLATLCPNKTIYGFDSFEGLPEDWVGRFKKGAFDLEGKLPSVKDNVDLVKGWFEESLPKFLEKHTGTCAFVHIDCDLYSSARTVFHFLRDYIVSGTVIQFDEYYNYTNWKNHEYKAFQEFITERGLTYEYLGYVVGGNAQQVSVVIK